MTQAAQTSIDPANRAVSSEKRPKVFLSYTSRGDESDAHDIKGTVGRLEEELRLRGFEVFLDTSSIEDAAPVESEIFDQIDQSDVFIAVLTPTYLERDYCLREFERARIPHRKATRIYPIAIGLGGDRETVQHTTWDLLHFDFSAHWIRSIFMDFGRDHSAEVAKNALKYVFQANMGPADGEWRICLISRGSPASFDGLTLDASPIFGQSTSEVGTEADWLRLHEAVSDVEKVLRSHGQRRRVVFSPQCHLPAALMFGWVFRRNAGWSLTTMQGESLCSAESTGDETVLNTEVEHGAFDVGGGRFAIALDVKQRSIGEEVRRTYPQSPRGFLWASGSKSGDLNAAEIGAAAVHATQRITECRDSFKPMSLDIFMAAPASFAALVGHRLGSIHCSMKLFECDKRTGEYHEVISLEEK